MSEPDRRVADVIMLSTADWDNPFWTNKQHVAIELARRGHRVLYIDSLGLRRPSVSVQDAQRILRRLWRALRPPRQVRSGLWVWSPVVIPLQRYALVRALNRALLSAGLHVWQRVLQMRRDVLWTYNPMTTRLFPTNGFATVAYHCVDEIKAQPGMPAREIESAERELLGSADICFVTAAHLLQTRRALNPNTFYFSNVADFEHFAHARDESLMVPEDLARLPAPRIGFVGAISAYKLDLPLLRRLAQAHPEWSVVLIGKVGEGDPWTNISALADLPNLHFLGPRAYDTLPGYLKGFAVGLLPCALNDYTRGMFPMKFFEYLAAGCPVVSTALPALSAHVHVAHVASSHDEFVVAVERAVAGDCASLSERLAAAREQTYTKRTGRMLELLDASTRG